MRVAADCCRFLLRQPSCRREAELLVQPTFEDGDRLGSRQVSAPECVNVCIAIASHFIASLVMRRRASLGSAVFNGTVIGRLVDFRR